MEKNEEFFDEKKDKKSTFQRVMNIILWVVLFIWMGICLVDFFCPLINCDNDCTATMPH